MGAAEAFRSDTPVKNYPSVIKKKNRGQAFSFASLQHRLSVVFCLFYVSANAAACSLSLPQLRRTPLDLVRASSSSSSSVNTANISVDVAPAVGRELCGCLLNETVL